jgi:hypothetical protein
MPFTKPRSKLGARTMARRVRGRSIILGIMRLMSRIRFVGLILKSLTTIRRRMLEGGGESGKWTIPACVQHVGSNLRWDADGTPRADQIARKLHYNVVSVSIERRQVCVIGVINQTPPS